MSLVRPLSRLSLRIYLIGLLQLAVAALAFSFVHRLFERAHFEREDAPLPGWARALGELFDQPEALRRAMAQLNGEHLLELTFYRANGSRVASTDAALPPLGATEVSRLRVSRVLRDQNRTTAVAIMHDDDFVGYGLLRLLHDGQTPDEYGHEWHESLGRERRSHGHGTQLAVALVASAIIALLFARSLARPLARLARAAEAFGSGDLSARADLRRDDEIGAVARTFDDMADRVNTLMRTQREFLGNVSHELRAPLARIRVALDIAAEGDVEAARASLADITEDWGDLERLVDSLITIARMDLAGDPRVPAAALRLELLDAVHLVERAAAGIRATHPRHQLVVEHEAATLPMIGDSAMLRRVLDNLMTNAAKYSDPSAPIHVCIGSLGDDVVFTVTDRGIGIESADLPHLFEPFFRADRSRTRTTGGAGLGLALVKRIVDAHHGRISVDSAVGIGTTVTFTIPSSPSSIHS